MGESSVRIDPAQIFGTRLKAAEALMHYRLDSSGAIEVGTFRQFYVKNPNDCTQPIWKDVAQVITVSTGRRKCFRAST